MTTTLITITQHYRAQLKQQDAHYQRLLATQHAHMLAAIQPHLDALYQHITDVHAQEQPLSILDLYVGKHIQSITQAVTYHVSQFAAFASRLVQHAHTTGTALGTQAGHAQVQAVSKDAPLVQQSYTSTPDTLPTALYAHEASQQVTGALLVGVALQSPVKQISTRVGRALVQPLHRAVAHVGHSLVSAFRRAASAVYRADSVIIGWVWWAELDANPPPCPACIAMHGTEHPLSEEMESHPNCFPAGTIVSGPRIVGSTTRWYEGEIVDIKTARGNFLTVTPNHPILTSHGWVAAGLLNEGSDVISYSRRHSGHSSPVSNPDDYQVEAPIEQVAATFGESAAMSTISMPTAPKDFHGDGIGSQVHVIRTYRHLRDNLKAVKSIDAALFQPFSQQQFSRRCAQLLQLARLCPTLFPFNRGLLATYCSMRRLSIFSSFLSGTLSDDETISSGLTSQWCARLLQPQANSIPSNAERFSEGIFRLTRYIARNNFIDRQSALGENGAAYVLAPQLLTGNSVTYQAALSQGSFQPALSHVESMGSVFDAISSDICIDRILKITVRRFSGHVYNLQSTEGWYISNNIITHNCRCLQIPYAASWRGMQSGTAWFEEQSAARQENLLGASKYAAYARGDFTLAEVVGYSQYGIYEKSLRQLIG